MRSTSEGRLQRLLLVPFPALALWLGLGYLLGDDRRYASTSFLAAKRLAGLVVDDHPMQVWGVVFLAGAGTLAWGLARGVRRQLATALFIGGCIYAFWAWLLLWSALSDPAASPNGPARDGFIASVHFVAAWWVWVRT